MQNHHLSKEARLEMLRAHHGLVTAVRADDNALVTAQTRAILADHLEHSNSNLEILLVRLGKQIEAGARVTASLVGMLAARTGMTPDEVQRALAEAAQDDLPLPD